MTEGRKFDFTKWLQEEIEKSGMSLYELEDISGVSEQSLSLYLHNKCLPTLRTFSLLLDAFGKHIEIVDN